MSARTIPILGGVLLLLAPFAGANEFSDLSTYLAYAAEHNPGLMAADRRADAASAAVGRARALPDPVLSVGYFAESVETRVGPQRQRWGITQKLPWFGKRGLAAAVAQGSADAARASGVDARLALFFEIKHAYHERYAIQRAVAVTERGLRLVEELEQVVLTRYRTGQGTQSAPLYLQIERKRLRDRLAELADRDEVEKAHLNALLGRPPDAELPPVAILPAVPEGMSPETLRRRLRGANPRLQALDARVDGAVAAERLAARAFYPDVTVGLQYIDTGDALDPRMTDSGKDPMVATLAVNLPIWIGAKRAAGEEARWRLEATRHERRELEERLLADLREACFEFQSADRRVRLYRDELVPLAEQASEVTLRAFSGGEVDYRDVIEAERKLLDLELTLAQSEAARGRTWARIEMLTGAKGAGEGG